MTTKEFIKMLQDADPSGDAHVRMSGGIPYYAMAKPGYYDGPYSFLDENENHIQSTKGTKVDIYCKEIYDIIEDNYDDKISKEDNWKIIESKFIFDYNAYSIKNQRTERQEIFMKGVYKEFEDYSKFIIDFNQSQLEKNIEQGRRGWTWFQNKLVDSNDPGMHKYYTWLIYDENNKSQTSCLANNERIQDCENWERVDNNVKEGYYQWIFKEKQK